MEEKHKKLVLETLKEMANLQREMAKCSDKIAALLVDVNPELINFKKQVVKKLNDDFSLKIYFAMKEFAEENPDNKFWGPHYMDLLKKAESDLSSKKVGHLVRKGFDLSVERDAIGYCVIYQQEDLDRIKELLIKAGHELA